MAKPNKPNWTEQWNSWRPFYSASALILSTGDYVFNKIQPYFRCPAEARRNYKKGTQGRTSEIVSKPEHEAAGHHEADGSQGKFGLFYRRISTTSGLDWGTGCGLVVYSRAWNHRGKPVWMFAFFHHSQW